MLKYTKYTLQKLESLMEELQYKVRYEKGNFQSGYCMVQDQKIAVISKFFDTQARVQTLLEILVSLEVKDDQLSDKGRELYRKALKQADAKTEESSK